MPQVICWKMQPPPQLIVQLISKLHCYPLSFFCHLNFRNGRLSSRIPDPLGSHLNTLIVVVTAQLVSILASIAKLP